MTLHAPPDYDLRCRSAVVSTLLAGLELAREGQITLAQRRSFGDIAVHAATTVTLAGQEAEVGG